MKNANYLTAALTALAIVSCTDSDTAENTLGGDGQKTPLVVTAAIDDVAATTRAKDKTFEKYLKYNVIYLDITSFTARPELGDKIVRVIQEKIILEL